ATLDKERNYLEIPYFSDEFTSTIEPRPIGRGLTEYVLRTGQAALIDKSRVKALADEGELDKRIPENMAQTSNSWLGSPLVVEGEIYGVIAVQTYDEDSPYGLRD